MTLGEILAARADNTRAREIVEIGSLGSIMLEALPIQDLERFSRGADGDRAVFYAASRELQSVGAVLLSAGKVSRPDQVMAFVSGEEAAKAADAVRALSGWSGAAVVSASPSASEQAEKSTAQDDTPAPPSAIERARVGQDSHETEIRHRSVQENEVRPESVQKNKVRLDTVRTETANFAEIRPSSVQVEFVRGQNSHEFLTENGETATRVHQTQVLRDESADEPQNVEIPDRSGGSLQNPISGSSTGLGEIDGDEIPPMHETESEFDAALHEIESELGAEKTKELHETESEIRESMHEIKSESEPKTKEGLHEIRSESETPERDDLPIYRGVLHETESELEPERRESVHETESELTERVARGILDGLRRAAWVR